MYGTGLGQAYISVFQGLFEVDTNLAGKGMIVARNQNKTVTSVGQKLQTSILCRGSSNSDIGGAVEHCLHHLMAQTFTEFDIDVGMCRQVARENVGHELIHGRRIGTHLHQALNSARRSEEHTSELQSREN